MILDVPLSKDSKQYIEDTFKAYEEVDEKLTQLNGKTIIHLYPVEDTMMDGIDNIKGFIDALFCEVHVYDVTNRKVYKGGYCDGVSIRDINSHSLRIFKDLSTMIIIEEPVKIHYYLNLEIEGSRR